MQQIKQLKLASSLLFTSSPVLFSFIFYWNRVRSEGMRKKIVQQSRFSLCQEINISFGASSLLLVLGIQLRPHLFYSLHFFSRSQSTTEKTRESWIDKKLILFYFFLTAQKYLKRNEHCNISHGIKQTDIYLRSRHFLPANSFFWGQF